MMRIVVLEIFPNHHYLTGDFSPTVLGFQNCSRCPVFGQIFGPSMPIFLEIFILYVSKLVVDIMYEQTICRIFETIIGIL